MIKNGELLNMLFNSFQTKCLIGHSYTKISMKSFQEILVFQHDQTTEVRKFVLGFIEEAW